jgi:hypothetical protein
LVEHELPKLGVASSSLVSRSRKVAGWFAGPPGNAHRAGMFGRFIGLTAMSEVLLSKHADGWEVLIDGSATVWPDEDWAALFALGMAYKLGAREPKLGDGATPASLDLGRRLATTLASYGAAPS